eukprot:1025362-Prymnesium_polylepis.1
MSQFSSYSAPSSRPSHPRRPCSLPPAHVRAGGMCFTARVSTRLCEARITLSGPHTVAIIRYPHKRYPHKRYKIATTRFTQGWT